MINKNEIEMKNLAHSTNILPKLMHYFLSSFKPQLDIPIKKNEIKTLFELHIHPNKPMKHYINTVDMESGSFTYLADKLEKKGLIKRVSSEEDKRKTVLSLTDEGEKITNKIIKMFDEHITSLISVLEDPDLEELQSSINSLERIYKKLNSNESE